MLVVGVAGGGGCLYTDPVNMPPSISIIPPAQVFRGQPAMFTAMVSDSDKGAVSLGWTSTSGPCPGDFAQASWPSTPVMNVDTFVVPSADTSGPQFCVWAFATDHLGAVTADHKQITPLDRAPQPVIQVVLPAAAAEYPIFSDFELSGVASTDPDDTSGLTYEWTLLQKPPGSTSTLSSDACSDNLGAAYACMTPDVAGVYQVKLEVGDPEGQRGTATQDIQVLPDQLPCLVATSPDLTADHVTRDPMTDDGRMFTVAKVDDDGDPFPPGPGGNSTHFSWFIGHGTAPVVFQPGLDFPVLTIPFGTFTVGEVARVRVEIHDRNPQPINQILSACGDEAATCPTAGRVPGCTQRKTWTVQF